MITLETELAGLLSGEVLFKKCSLAKEESVTVKFRKFDLSGHGCFVK